MFRVVQGVWGGGCRVGVWVLGVMSNFAGFGVIRVLTLFNKMLGVVLFSCGL